MNPCIAPTSFLATGSNKQKLKMKEVIYVHKQKSRQKDKKKRVNSSEPAITYIWGCGPGSYCVDLLQWLSATKHKFKWTVCLDTFPFLPFFSNEASSFAACLLGKTKIDANHQPDFFPATRPVIILNCKIGPIRKKHRKRSFKQPLPSDVLLGPETAEANRYRWCEEKATNDKLQHRI